MEKTFLEHIARSLVVGSVVEYHDRMNLNSYITDSPEDYEITYSLKQVPTDPKAKYYAWDVVIREFDKGDRHFILRRYHGIICESGFVRTTTYTDI